MIIGNVHRNDIKAFEVTKDYILTDYNSAAFMEQTDKVKYVDGKMFYEDKEVIRGKSLQDCVEQMK